MMKWSPSVMSDFWPDPMDCSLPGSSVLGIFQARVLEWGAISFSRRFSPPRDQTRVSCIVERCFTAWATREVSEISWWNQLVIFRRQYFGQQTPPNSHIHGGVFLWHTPGPMPLLTHGTHRSVSPGPRRAVVCGSAVCPVRLPALWCRDGWPMFQEIKETVTGSLFSEMLLLISLSPLISSLSVRLWAFIYHKFCRCGLFTEGGDSGVSTNVSLGFWIINTEYKGHFRYLLWLLPIGLFEI